MSPSASWFVANGQVVRLDVDDSNDVRWTFNLALDDALGPLSTLAVTGFPAGARISGGFGLPDGTVVLVTDEGWVTLDPQRGVLVDGPFDQTRWFCLQGVELGELVVGLPGARALFLHAEGSASTYSIFDPTLATLDGPNLLSGLSFSGPQGAVPMRLDENTVAAALIPPGWLYLFWPDGHCRLYELTGKTTDDFYHPLVDDFYQLSEAGFVPQYIVSVADGDGAPGEYPGLPDTAVVQAVTEVLDPDQKETARPYAVWALLIAEAESGLRTGAFNPAGRYGLYSLDAAELTAVGWLATPASVLTVADGALQQLVEDILNKADAYPSVASAGALWANLLTLDDGTAMLSAATVTPATVVAAPGGPRPDLWQSHAVADVGGDGQLDVADLDAYLDVLRATRRWGRITRRLAQLGLPTS